LIEFGPQGPADDAAWQEMWRSGRRHAAGLRTTADRATARGVPARGPRL